MSNFGVTELRLVRPFEVAFREARSAVGAADLLARAKEFSQVADAVSDCVLVVGTTAGRNREIAQPLRPLPEAAGYIRRKLARGKVALLFGSEKTGLSNDELSHCHWLAHVPTQESHVSMNLGQAVAVCLYELARRGNVAATARDGLESRAAEMERINLLLMEVLQVSGYLKPDASFPARARIRQLVRRMNLQPKDAEVWLGMLRQILWKMRQAE